MDQEQPFAALILTPADFEHLTSGSTALRSGVKPTPASRWPEQDASGAPFSESRWRYVYDFEGWAALVLARAFLTAQNADYQVVHDHDGTPLIFTDYASPSWYQRDQEIRDLEAGL
jgi:hypothetical protein